MADNRVIFEVVATAKGVKVVQKQTDELAKSTERADRGTQKLTKSRDRYSRTEKGVANISSNSTKNFSKMQQNIDGGGGGGGLVRAYALLAANVFALTAAFGVLSRSAQIDTLTESMDRLSATGGSSINQISKDLVTASGGAIAFADGMRQVALATSAGLGAEQIQQLTTVAKGASIALGRNLGDSLDRIFRGAIKLEPELLDEIGLFVRVDEESQKYARTLGKTVTSLTQYEKRQAFLNGVIDQGTKKFQDFAEQVDPDAYTKLGAALADIAQSATSFINKALGPLIGFLTESRGLLVGLFSIVAGILLKQAIPALGQFTASIAVNASEAAKQSTTYIEGVKAQALEREKANQRILLSNKKILEEERQTTLGRKKPDLSFVTRKEVTDAAQKLKTETNRGERLKLLNQKINGLEKSRKKVRQENKAIIDQELQILKKEKTNIEQQIKLTRQLKQERATRTGTEVSGPALIKQQNLLTRATNSAALSAVVQTGDINGLRAGFGTLFKTLDTGEVLVDGTTQKLGKLGKVGLLTKGSFALLTNSLGGLISKFIPAGIALSFIAPFLPIIGKYFGIISKESTALEKSTSSLVEENAKLADRFKIQIKAFKDTKLSVIEQTKALLAYNTTQKETFERIKKSQTDLKIFKDNLGPLATAWENFKAIFNLDRESTAIKAQIEGITESIKGAIDFGDEERLDAFKGINESLDLYINKAQDSTTISAALQKAREEAAASGKTEEQINAAIAKGQEILNRNDNQRQYQINNQVDGLGNLVSLSLQQAQSTEELNKASTDLKLTEEERNDIGKKSLEIDEERTRVLNTFISAAEGARESVSKFNSAFIPKTAVDEVTASLRQLSQSFIDLRASNQGAQVESFFTNFSEQEVSSLFDPFEKNLIEISALFGDFETSESIFNNVKTIFENIQKNLIVNKALQSNITGLQKQYAAAAEAGEIAIQGSVDLQTKVKQLQSQIALDTLTQQVRAKGISAEQALQLAQTENLVELKALALQLGLSESDAAAAASAGLNLLKAKREETLQLATEQFQVDKQVAELSLKRLAAEKEGEQIAQRRAALQQKIASFETRGTTTLTAAEQFKLEVDAAKQSRDIAEKEAESKKAVIEAEYAILRERVNVLDLEGNVKKQLIANLESAETQAINNVDNAVLELGEKVKISVLEGFVKGINAAKSGDIVGGVQTSIQAATDPDGAGGTGITFQEKINLAKTALAGFEESLRKLGPEGEFVAEFTSGAINIADSIGTIAQAGFSSAEGLQAVGSAIQSVGGILAAESKMQISAIDQQIEAEKRRDGQSAQSVAKIAALEKKKEAMARKAFEQQKKVQMAVTIANTAAAIMASLAPPPIGLGPVAGMPMAAMYAALGALQLAVISRTSYQGGGNNAPEAPNTSLTIGSRGSSVDVAQKASGGELAYLRGGRGVGTNANNFTPGAAMGRKGYADGDTGITVGERGPEVISPAAPIDITPNYALGSGTTNVNFNISAVDGASVQNMLNEQQGNIIAMIRQAANDNGEGFLESVDPTVYGGGGG